MSKKTLIVSVAAVVVVLVLINLYRGHHSRPKDVKAAPVNTQLVDEVKAKQQEVKPAVDPKDQQLIDQYTAALKKGGNDAENYYQRALVYQRIQQYLLAVQDYTQAIKLSPDSENAYFNRGLTYYQEKYLDDAIKDFTDAIKLQPKDQHVYNARGLVYSDQNDLDDAMSDFNQALTLDPAYGSAYFNRATIYERQQKYKEALADYDAAIKNNKAEIDNEDPKVVADRLEESYYRRSIINLEINDFNAAMRDVNYVIENNPKLGKAFKLRASIYTKLGNTGAAAADESTAQDLDLEQIMR